MIREFEFDMDVVLKNCERFCVEVDDIPGKVTINGEDFDVVDKINKILELDKSDV